MTQYNITIKTGDVHGAGTDGDVEVSLCGQSNMQSSWFNLDKSWYNDFERNDCDTYTIDVNNYLGEISYICVNLKEKMAGDAWYLDWVEVEEAGTNNIWYGEPKNHWFQFQHVTANHAIENSTNQMFELKKIDPSQSRRKQEEERKRQAAQQAPFFF